MDSDLRAALAVREFNRIVPGLTSYVRAMTGNSTLVVRAHPITSTDGKFVNIRPPLALADPRIHDRRLCDIRDPESFILSCSACERTEIVYASLYHEMSHITSGSLADIGQVIAEAMILRGLERAKASEKLSNYIKRNTGSIPKNATIYTASGAVHPHLLALVRVLDDVVIENNASRARSGVGNMLEALTMRILVRGVESEDGEFFFWKDQPTEVQLPIALLSEMRGFELEGNFSKEAIDLIRSDEIQELAKINIQNTKFALAAAVAFLSKFNELGYFLVDMDEPEPEETEESDDSEEGEDGKPEESDDDSGDGSPGDMGDSGDDGSSDSDDSMAGGDDSSGSAGGEDEPMDNSGDSSGADSGGNGESSPGGQGAGQGNQDSGTAEPSAINGALDQVIGHDIIEQIMQEGYKPDDAFKESLSDDQKKYMSVEEAKCDPAGHDEGGDEESHNTTVDAVGAEELLIAITQAMQFDDVSREVGTVEVITDNRGAMAGRHQRLDIEETTVAGHIMRARRVFSDNDLDKHVSNLKKGKVSPKSLGARGWGDDRRVFRKKIRADKTDYEVVIGMDCSGSTNGPEIKNIKNASWALSELLNRIGVRFSLYAHTTTYTFASRMNQEIYVIKDADTRWNSATVDRLSRLKHYSGSFDGHNFEFYRKILQRSEAKKKILVYFTDGQIPNTNHAEEAAIMSRESKMYARLGFETIVVSVGIELVDSYGFEQVSLDRTSDIKNVLDMLEKKLK